MKKYSITRSPTYLCATLAFSAVLWLMSPATSAADNAPPLMLANSYHPGIRLADYWVSEKYDGVRGYWDGKQLLTRGGQPVIAPHWFTAGWPATPMDGELWAGRGQFNLAVSTARRETPDDSAWRGMRFMVFDLPAHGGTFNQRLKTLQDLIPKLKAPWVEAVAQTKISNHATLQRMLERTVSQGGEGLMLHRGASFYQGLRNEDLLKLKTHEDAEATVVAYLPGKGKYQGMMGALVVETPQGLRFKLGSGFNDDQRRQPPALGSLITYRFRGLNPSGIPRFASFMREYQQ